MLVVAVSDLGGSASTFTSTVQAASTHVHAVSLVNSKA
jgi:hypothetical protein